MKLRAFPGIGLLLLAIVIPGPSSFAQESKPLKALFLTGGGYHDYAKLTPHLTNHLGAAVKVSFDVVWDLEPLKKAKFADPYDVIVYDFCWDEAETNSLDHALQAMRDGKPAVMIHCAVHAFRRTSSITEWENGCGMRSKIHDPYQSFRTEKVDPKHPILTGFPDDWQTPGDELYQTIEMTGNASPLLKVKSPHDGRVHTVCWTHTFGKGRVFATTLGHDMKTAENTDYLRLLARGLLWACDKLESKDKTVRVFSENK